MHDSSMVVNTINLYSTSIEDLTTNVCYLEDQEMRLPFRLTR